MWTVFVSFYPSLQDPRVNLYSEFLYLILPPQCGFSREKTPTQLYFEFYPFSTYFNHLSMPPHLFVFSLSLFHLLCLHHFLSPTVILLWDFFSLIGNIFLVLFYTVVWAHIHKLADKQLLIGSAVGRLGWKKHVFRERQKTRKITEINWESSATEDNEGYKLPWTRSGSGEKKIFAITVMF